MDEQQALVRAINERTQDLLDAVDINQVKITECVTSLLNASQKLIEMNERLVKEATAKWLEEVTSESPF